MFSKITYHVEIWQTPMQFELRGHASVPASNHSNACQGWRIMCGIGPAAFVMHASSRDPGQQQNRDREYYKSNELRQRF